MAFDDVPGSDPRGPICPGCSYPVLKDQPSTIIHSQDNTSATWHGECSRHLWDKLTPMMKRMGWA